MSMFVHLRGEGVKNCQNLVHVVIERSQRTKIATHLNCSTATKLRLLYSATLAMLSKCYSDAGSA